jgi:hypothetical protein
MNDLLGGQVQVLFGTTAVAIEHVRGGKVRAEGLEVGWVPRTLLRGGPCGPCFAARQRDRRMPVRQVVRPSGLATVALLAPAKSPRCLSAVFSAWPATRTEFDQRETRLRANEEGDRGGRLDEAAICTMTVLIGAALRLEPRFDWGHARRARVAASSAAISTNGSGLFGDAVQQLFAAVPRSRSAGTLAPILPRTAGVISSVESHRLIDRFDWRSSMLCRSSRVSSPPPRCRFPADCVHRRRS